MTRGRGTETHSNTAKAPLGPAIDRHLAQGRMLFHGPLMPERLVIVRQFLDEGRRLAERMAKAGLAGERRTERVHSIHVALASRLLASRRNQP